MKKAITIIGFMVFISPILAIVVPNPLQLTSGGDSSIKMPRCVCWGSENVPVLKDALSKKNIPILKGFFTYPYYGVISS